jgi:mono/diheme cytochrome c family protein
LVCGCGPSVSISDPAPAVSFGGGPSGLADPNTPLFGGTVTKSSGRAYPINGGTLLVTRDGNTAVAADPDRGKVFLADLTTRAVRTVALDENDEIGRVVEGKSGVVYVIARRGGAVVRVDVAAATGQRFAACNAPRGIAYDDTSNNLYVTCASGAILTMNADSGAIVRKASIKVGNQVKDDLRDVVVLGDKLVVTRFRNAEIMTLDSSGNLLSSQVPNAVAFTGRAGPATLAFRAIPNATGGVKVVHQSSSDTVLGTGLGAYYGGNCGGSVADTFVTDVPSVTTAASTVVPSQPTLNATSLGGATGPLDIAISHDGSRTAIVATGNSWTLASANPAVAGQESNAVQTLEQQRPTLRVFDGGAAGGGCWDEQATKLDEPGEAVAVAFDANGKYIVQYREPAKLILEKQPGQLVHQISLSTDSRFDTGLALFHVNSGGGIACASCHPEGGVDGHVWNFQQIGTRVTQPLQGKVSLRAPFHWSGDLATWDNLIDEVMMKRMSMPLKPTGDQSQALLSWLDTIQTPPATDDLDQASVARGRTLFNDATIACSTCHSGGIFSDNKPHDVGTGGTFIAPSLLGVGAREPLMHNGCAKTLVDRFGSASCTGGDQHGKTSQLSDQQKGDLVAYLQSL